MDIRIIYEPYVPSAEELAEIEEKNLEFDPFAFAIFLEGLKAARNNGRLSEFLNNLKWGDKSQF